LWEAGYEPGTILKNAVTGALIYEPPQDAAEVESLMGKTNFDINESLFALLSNVTLERP